MTENERLTSVKSGLGITGNTQDTVITQKTAAVLGYIINSGVSEEQADSDLGIAVICLGVTDLWSLAGGEIKFSPAFGMILEQLKVMSLE